MIYNSHSFYIGCLKKEDALNLNKLFVLNTNQFKQYLPKTLSENRTLESTKSYIIKREKALISKNEYTFTINNGARFPVDSCVAVYANEYLITVVDSSGNCSYTETIFIDQPNEISVDAGPDQEINLGESSEPIFPSILADNNIVNLAWTPLDSLECLDIDCQNIIVSPISDLLYTFSVEDENGCTASDDILITVNTSRNVYIPNIFTPNEDGVNDYFNIVIGSGAVSVSYLSIFDRWGNKVYDVETEYVPEQTISNGWDGKFNGQYVNPGVYVYMARVNFIDGKSLDYSGDITVIR